MAENTNPRPAAQNGTTARVEAAVSRLQELYAARYGSEFAALVRLDDFDL